MTRGHYCKAGEWLEGDRGWELIDAAGIYCGRVCDRCETEKRAQFRPEIFSGYDERDTNEEGEGQ